MLRRPWASKNLAQPQARLPVPKLEQVPCAASVWPTDWRRRLREPRPVVTRLLTALHADMVGYSRLFLQDDRGTVARLLGLHRHQFAPAIRHFMGHLVQTGGDSLLVLFDSVGQAVQCAVALQSALAHANNGFSASPPIQLRIGVDLGDVIMDGLNFHGDGVIIATRLQAVCPPGGVCVSRAVYERGGERLGLRAQSLGSLALKHVARPVEAFVLWPLADHSAEVLMQEPIPVSV